jgi:hypothetical protein
MRSAQLLDESGDRPRLVDVGRDDAVKPVAVPGPKRASVAAGTTCFVMQPFAGPLGSYYEAIFRPAIDKAGLNAMRANDDMFATGKIMDQVWRGIRHASVLVAELTSKNPNVFYELGLAHALEKPVILVSSNQEDVPFDLRHIRVILYRRELLTSTWRLADKFKAQHSTPKPTGRSGESAAQLAVTHVAALASVCDRAASLGRAVGFEGAFTALFP